MAVVGGLAGDGLELGMGVVWGLVVWEQGVEVEVDGAFAGRAGLVGPSRLSLGGGAAAMGLSSLLENPEKAVKGLLAGIGVALENSAARKEVLERAENAGLVLGSMLPRVAGMGSSKYVGSWSSMRSICMLTSVVELGSCSLTCSHRI
jgi:hypothetical protein